MKNKILLYLVLSIGIGVFSGCRNVKAPVTKVDTNNKYLLDDFPRREYSVQSVLWQQNAGEYRALCYQAFNIAKVRLDGFLADESLEGKKLAIITDIDETVLDNSPFNAKLIQKNEEFTQDEWNKWSFLEEARAIPGAKEFLDYAYSKGVEVFYVTNRTMVEEEATLRNMKKVGFPYADRAHLFLKKETSSKKERLENVRKNHTVVLYLGDNLGDFSEKFAVPNSQKRNEVVDGFRDNFGYNFIVLPNPMYGDWETKALYKERYDWSDFQKDSIRKADIRSY